MDLCCRQKFSFKPELPIVFPISSKVKAVVRLAPRLVMRGKIMTLLKCPHSLLL